MSDSVRPHRWQPTRLPRPWDSPGKNTGVGCHFPLQCMKMKSESEVTQSCLTLSDPMDCSLPGSSIHGIFQARVLEWGAIAAGNFMWDLELVSLSRPQSFRLSNEGVGPDGIKPPLIQSSVCGWLTTLSCQQLKLPRELSQAMAMGRGKNGSFTRAICVG